jgi:hypothetical protein
MDHSPTAASADLERILASSPFAPSLVTARSLETAAVDLDRLTTGALPRPLAAECLHPGSSDPWGGDATAVLVLETIVSVNGVDAESPCTSVGPEGDDVEATVV